MFTLWVLVFYYFKAKQTFCYITNADGSMFVHEVRGVVFVTWVSRKDKEEAMRFPTGNAADWAKLISDMTGVECIPTAPQRIGML
jgi:hypothetical protein